MRLLHSGRRVSYEIGHFRYDSFYQIEALSREFQPLSGQNLLLWGSAHWPRP